MEFLVILFFFGLSAGVIGKIKGASFFLWFLIGFCLPFVGTLAALFARFERNEPMRRCEECGRRRRPARPGLHDLRARPRLPGAARVVRGQVGVGPEGPQSRW